jgi:hypothetical protein
MDIFSTGAIGEYDASGATPEEDCDIRIKVYYDSKQ